MVAAIQVVEPAGTLAIGYDCFDLAEENIMRADLHDSRELAVQGEP